MQALHFRVPAATCEAWIEVPSTTRWLRWIDPVRRDLRQGSLTVGAPAARVGDPTAPGGTLAGPGVPTVLIGETGAGSPLGSAAAAALAKSASHGHRSRLDRPSRPSIGGRALLLRDTRGEAIPGMSNAEGRFTAPGQEAEGRFTVVVRLLRAPGASPTGNRGCD